jgi:hypothetical protein
MHIIKEANMPKTIKYGPELKDYPDTKNGWKQLAIDREHQLITQMSIYEGAIKKWQDAFNETKEASLRHVVALRGIQRIIDPGIYMGGDYTGQMFHIAQIVSKALLGVKQK